MKLIRIAKRLWNKIVQGFETAALHAVLFVVGLADNYEVMSLQQYLPEKFGQVFIGISVLGIVCRYFIKIGWIKEFEDVDGTA